MYAIPLLIVILLISACVFLFSLQQRKNGKRTANVSAPAADETTRTTKKAPARPRVSLVPHSLRTSSSTTKNTSGRPSQLHARRIKVWSSKDTRRKIHKIEREARRKMYEQRRLVA